MSSQESTSLDNAYEVRRKIKIPALGHAADAMAVERAVGALTGVRKVATDVNKHQVVVRYDASQSTYEKVLAVLENVGFPPSDNWWYRLKGNWFQFSDTNASDNAKAPPPACCNRPPK